MSYRRDPNEDLHDHPTWIVWVISTVVACIVAGVMGWFGDELAAITKLSFFNSTFFVVVVAMIMAGGVERLLRETRD